MCSKPPAGPKRGSRPGRSAPSSPPSRSSSSPSSPPRSSSSPSSPLSPPSSGASGGLRTLPQGYWKFPETSGALQRPWGMLEASRILCRERGFYLVAIGPSRQCAWVVGGRPLGPLSGSSPEGFRGPLVCSFEASREPVGGLLGISGGFLEASLGPLGASRGLLLAESSKCRFVPPL